ncbi:MAG: hypothetical protein V1749_05370 [Candidatus Desantisbacteria bacterium]
MKILQFLQDEKGIFSSTRLAFLIWAIGMFVVWTIKTIYAGVNSKGQFYLVDVPETAVWVLGALMAGKVVQKFRENPQKNGET